MAENIETTDTATYTEPEPFMTLFGDAVENVFAGPLPKVGDSCEWLCVEAKPGRYRFKLRVKQKGVT